MNEYFISYSWNCNNQSGFGSVWITLEKEIRNSYDTDLIMELIQDGNKANNIVILNWIKVD